MNKKILSWDVGIKNLAYCIINKTDNEYTIEKWDSINIIEGENYICEGFQKNNKKCTKKATYIKNDHYFCKMHKDGNKKDISEFNEQFEICNEEKCTHKNKNNIMCNKKSKFMRDNDYYCTIHKSQLLKNLVKGEDALLIKKVKCTSRDPQYIAEEMYKKLNEIKELLSVEEVLIENQPGLVAPTMKTISSMLFSYFIMNGTLNKSNSTICKVKFASATNKLKISEEKYKKVYALLTEKQKEQTTQLNNDKNKQTEKEKRKEYIIRKDTSEAYTKVLLENNKPMLDHLNKYKKQDDMCDAFLQGYHYLFKNN
jgi:hypothetical protein